MAANHTSPVECNAQLSPGEQTGAAPRLALLAGWRYVCLGCGWELDARPREDISKAQGGLENQRTPLFMSFAQSATYLLYPSHLAYLRSWGSLQNIMRSLQLSGGNKLGVTCEPRPRHIHPPIRNTLGISHPVRLQHTLV